MTHLHSFLFAGVIFLLNGCTVGPDYEPPKMDFPEEWLSYPKSQARSLKNFQWWRTFGDPVLIELIQKAIESNQDIQIAIKQIQQYQLLLGLSENAFLPALGATASGVKNQFSIKEPTTQPANRKLSDFKAGLNVSYEIDFWGGLRRKKEQALAQLLGKEASKQTVLITVISHVAKTYLTLLAVSTQLKLTRQMAHNTQIKADLLEAQYQKGQVSLMDWERARSDVSNAQNQVTRLEQTYSQQTQALSLLLGGSPRQFHFSKDIQTLQRPILEGIPLPSSLLRRRPDLLEAEQNLRAMNAEIGIQMAALFPSFNLTGFLGFQSPRLGSLVVPGTSVWQYGGVINLPAFQGMSILQAIEATKAANEEAQHLYLKRVYTALHEVENALTAYVKTEEQWKASQGSLDALTSVYTLSQKRHEAGYSALADLKNAEIQRDTAQITAIDLYAQSLISAIDLYKALGGGWDQPTQNAPSPLKRNHRPPSP